MNPCSLYMSCTWRGSTSSRWGHSFFFLVPLIFFNLDFSGQLSILFPELKMCFICQCLSAFQGKTVKNPELRGVCPNMSYPVEIFFPKRELIITFSKINCSIDSRCLPRPCIRLQGLLAGNLDGQAKGLADIPRNIENNHQPAWLFSFPRVYFASWP